MPLWFVMEIHACWRLGTFHPEFKFHFSEGVSCFDITYLYRNQYEYLLQGEIFMTQDKAWARHRDGFVWTGGVVIKCYMRN